MTTYLRSNDLLPFVQHMIGGVRHTWESGILDVTKRMNVSSEMMGIASRKSVALRIMATRWTWLRGRSLL